MMKGTLITLFFSFVWTIGHGQSNGQNYVATHKLRVESIVADPWTLAKESVQTSIQYVDGLGRPIETVLKQGAASDGKDVIVPMVYDVFGREATKYLPYTRNATNGAFVPVSTAITEQNTFYNTGITGTGEGLFAVSKSNFEASPRGLVTQEYGPGKDWQSTNNKPVKYNYLTNVHGTATEQEQIIAWTINGSGMPVRKSAVTGFVLTGGYYATGQLSIKSVIDENGNESREYIDKSGKTILKKVYETGDMLALNTPANWIQTYYVYDAIGNLRFVFQPSLSHTLSLNATNIPSAADLNAAGFEYRYDSRNRMIAKKVPGAEWVEMVYDPFDRVVLVRDGNDQSQSVSTAIQLAAYDGKNYRIQGTGSVSLKPGYQFSASNTSSLVIGPNPIASKWTFTKYDHLNRPILTGEYIHSGTRETVQALVNTFYSNVSNPRFDSYSASGVIEKYTNLSFPKQHESGTAISAQDVLTVNYYDNYAFTTLSAPAGADTGKAKSQLTGTKTKILGTSTFLTSVTWYDSRYRVLKTHTENHLNGNDQITLEYFNKLRPEVKKATHVNLANGVTNTVVEEFQYDHLGQLTSATHKINGNATETVSNITYDKFGRVALNSLGSGLQTIDYQYNIRGWLSTINGGANSIIDAGDVFRMDLKYQDASTGFQQFNGNIGQILWKNVGGGPNQNVQEYRFTYDKVNRLKDADYLSSGANAHFDEKGINYDKNGNILTLQRRNGNTLIDNLTYTYSGNKLTKVTDATANVLGFVDGSNITEEYIYDPMGNMTSDKNKKVTVSYNHLNLPDQVLKENGDYVKFTYDAAGTKRKAETKTGTTIETRDYVGNFVFLNGQLEHIIHSEGRVVMEAGVPKYEYFLRDHLGNVRQVVRATTPGGRIATMEAANQEEESKHFEMLQPSRQSDHRHNVTEGGRDIAWLNAARGRILGPATSMEVNEGDSVHLSVYGKYVRKRRKAMKSAALPSGSAQQILSDLGNMAQSGGANPILLFQIADLVAADLEKKESPEAYMGYALYDADSNLYEKGKILLSSLAENRHEQLTHGIKVEKGGYIETFLVNETAEDVFFDNFRIQSLASNTVQVMHYYPFGMEMPALAYNNPAMVKNRYLYNGKEKIDEVGLLDYGARMYDPAIGRFFKIDRFSDKYLSFSPYQYAANNPIINIDVNGDWIYIMHGGVNYKYDKGAFHTVDENTGKYVESDVSNDEFLSGLLQGLNDLSSLTEKGGEIVEFFGNDENNVIITAQEDRDRGHDWGRVEDIGEIGVDMSLEGAMIPTEVGRQLSPFWLVLGHELAHQIDYSTNGEKVLDTWLENPGEPDSPIRQTEKFATHIENIMRGQAGLPLRTHYAVQDKKKEFEPSRILNGNGTSRFYHTLPIRMGTNPSYMTIPLPYRQ